nr:RecName: Full=Peroxidase [Pleurotus pulmonarius]
ADNPGDDGN